MRRPGTARRSNQNTRCQNLTVLNGGWIPADGNHEGMDMGCSRTRKERLDNLARQDRDDPTPYPTPWEYEHRPKEVLRDFKTHAMRVKRHSPKKTPGPTLDSQSSFRDGLICYALSGLRQLISVEPRFSSPAAAGSASAAEDLASVVPHNINQSLFARVAWQRLSILPVVRLGVIRLAWQNGPTNQTMASLFLLLSPSLVRIPQVGGE